MSTRMAVSPASQPGGPAPARSARRYDLDWLRALIVVGLIPFHAAVIFGATSAVGMKSGAPSQAATQAMGAFAGLALLFGMPLLFCVAGAAAWFALGARSPDRFVGERLLRLLVPLVVGSLTLVPIQTYFVLLSNPNLVALNPLPGAPIDPQHLNAFPAFYGQYLVAYGYFVLHYSPANVIIFWQHLWFLPRLLAYSLVALPLFVLLRRRRGRRLIAHLASFCTRPGALFLFALPLAASDILLQTQWLTKLTQGWPIYDDWQAFTFGLMLFAYGYILYADARFTAALKRQWSTGLIVGLAVCAPVVALTLLQKAPPLDHYSWAYAGFLLLRALGIWSLIYGILGLAMRSLAFTNRVLRYLTEATFPLYLIHMTLLTVIAFYVLQWRIIWPLQLLLIIVATYLASWLAYELVIKRTPVTRFVFGMPARRMRRDVSPGGRLTADEPPAA